MKKISYIVIFSIVILFIGCGDNKSSGNQEEEINSQLKEEASAKTKDLIGVTPEEIDAMATSVKKYPIKSGIITFEKKGFDATSKVMIYFDNYGTKERNETYNPEGEIEEIRFTDGKQMYVINYKYSSEKVAYIMGPGTSGTEMKFVAEPFTTDSDKQKYGYKKLANLKVVGKDCEAYSMKSNMGDVTFAGSENVLLYTKTKMSIGEFETKAIDLKENVDVDASLFKVPEGHEVKNR